MTNYIVEDNFDFFKELNETEISNDDSLSNTCMISHLPLTHNFITLPCSHCFNYIPLYKELCLHNNKRNIVCPYCRTVSAKFIPFIPLPSVFKIIGVNYPPKKCLPAPNCSVILKNGTRQGLACGQNGMITDNGIFCKKHNQCTSENIWTEEMEKLMTTKTVYELKQMLKKNKLTVGGVKKDLVRRLVLGK
jgi:hypothetical protein